MSLAAHRVTQNTKKCTFQSLSCVTHNEGFIHFLLGGQAEGAAVGQLHDVDGEALVSGLVAEVELHLRAAR